MTDEFRNELAAELYGELKADELKTVLKAFDIIATKYEITRAETALIAAGADILPPIVQAYATCKLIAGQSQNGVKNAVYTLQGLLRRTRKSVAEITANDIRKYLYEYAAEKGTSSRTLDKYRQTINAFYQWAAKEGYLSVNPAERVQKIRYEQTARRILTVEEQELIRNACADDRERAVIEFLLSTACRISELCGAKIADMDIDNGTVKVIGKGKKLRTLYLNDRAIMYLKAYLPHRSESDYIFTSLKKSSAPLETQTVRKIINAIIDRTTIAGKQSITPHSFRHTVASRMIKAGAQLTDVQKMLGHSNPATTMIYVHMDDTQVQQAHERYVV